MKHCLVLLSILTAMTGGLLGQPWPDINSERLEGYDYPNFERDSRHLYPTSLNTHSNVPPRFREGREHSAVEDDKEMNVIAVNDPPKIMESLASRIEEEEKELCHARILEKCGAAVIEGFTEAVNLPLDRKCRIRENFLHCVIKMKRRPCRKRSSMDKFITEQSIHALRQQMLTLLWSARGCVLGMEAP